MIELIFNDSGAASLVLAKATGDKSQITGMEIRNDYEGNEQIKDVRIKPYSGPKIKGDTSDVVSIWLLADRGDISQITNRNSHQKIINEISSFHNMEEDNWVEKECENFEAQLKRLYKARDKGEDIRIWWSDTPSETCGYYWAINLFKDSKSRITSVKVPSLDTDGDLVRIINGTSDLTPEDFVLLRTTEKVVSLKEIRTAAQVWEKLVVENKLLRSVINGLPYSVNEDFYDWVLWNVFPDCDFKVVEAIGLSMIEGPIGVSDWWYAKRIENFIRNKELEIVKENENFYYSTLRKAKK